MEETVNDRGDVEAEGRWAKQFLVNVIWSWVGVLASFVTGFFLSPFIIRTIGDQRYGIWALAFAFIDYFILFDFGFKSAIVNLISRYRAQHRDEPINHLVNTAFFYFSGLGVCLIVLTWIGAPELHRVFQISPAYRHEFTVLVRIVSFGWAVAMAMNTFQAGVEAFQRFKTQNHIYILSLVIRSGGCALALLLGGGLVEMGFVILVSQLTTNLLIFATFRNAFPALRISPLLVRVEAWKEMAGYGKHAFVAYLATMLLNQGPAMLIGHFRPEAFVGYFTLPSRLLQYVVELVTRIGSVTMPNTAELAATGRRRDIVTLGMYLNRYCLALFIPLAIFLLLYGQNLITAWVGSGFATYAAPLLPAFVTYTALATAAQFNSSQILFGLAKHDTYAKTVLVEGILSLAGITVILPQYGLVGAAWVVATLALMNRGLITPYLLCRALEFNLVTFMRSIYSSPLLIAIPVAVGAMWMKIKVLPGRNWPELLVALGLIALPYYVACYFAAIEPEHRFLLRNWVEGRLRMWRANASKALS